MKKTLGGEGDRTGVSDMIREMFLYYYGEHSQDVYNYEIGMGEDDVWI